MHIDKGRDRDYFVSVIISLYSENHSLYSAKDEPKNF